MFDFINRFLKRHIYANRQNKIDVYQYDEIPTKVRIQIIHIATKLLDKSDVNTWPIIYQHILEKKGFLSIAPKGCYQELSQFGFTFECYAYRACKFYIVDSSSQSSTYASTIDVLEFCEMVFNVAIYQRSYIAKQFNEIVDNINELNNRFKEAGIGYEMNKNSFKIIRIDNQYIHKEVVKPALNILNNHKFEKANEYYQNAHKYYLENKIEACITECGKCFESVLKTICEENGWQPDGVTAIRLIECVKQNDLFLPDAKIEKSFTQFIEMLKNGLPPIRNMASHGTILTTSSIPLYLASYAMHLTATNILLLQQAQEAYQHLKT